MAYDMGYSSKKASGYGDDAEGEYKASTYGDDNEGGYKKSGGYGDDNEGGYRKSGGYGDDNEGGSRRTGGYGGDEETRPRHGHKKDSDGDGIPDEFEKSQYNREDVSAQCDNRVPLLFCSNVVRSIALPASRGPVQSCPAGTDSLRS